MSTNRNPAFPRLPAARYPLRDFFIWIGHFFFGELASGIVLITLVGSFLIGIMVAFPVSLTVASLFLAYNRRKLPEFFWSWLVCGVAIGCFRVSWASSWNTPLSYWFITSSFLGAIAMAIVLGALKAWACSHN